MPRRMATRIPSGGRTKKVSGPVALAASAIIFLARFGPRPSQAGDSTKEPELCFINP